jgi:hypothetical protein
MIVTIVCIMSTRCKITQSAEPKIKVQVNIDEHFNMLVAILWTYFGMSKRMS